jgi:hypothetical protein
VIALFPSATDTNVTARRFPIGQRVAEVRKRRSSEMEGVLVARDGLRAHGIDTEETMVDCKWLTASGVLVVAMATVVGSARAGSAYASANDPTLAAKEAGVVELASKEAGVEFSVEFKDAGVMELAKEAGATELATDK